MWLQGPTSLIASQASTGLISTYIAPALSQLNKASSIKAVYDEYRLLKVRFHVRPATLSPGTTKFVLDDADATTPDQTWADSVRGYMLSNNSSDPKSTRTFTYASQDFDDLAWQSTYSDATYTPCALKMFSSLAAYGTPTSTNIWVITWEGLFEFRGIGANQ